MSGELLISWRDVQQAYEKIRRDVHRTPVITSSAIDHMVGCNVYFKAELCQKTGSFKSRGALNAVSRMINEKNVKHVVAYSGGNHGQGLAWAAQTLGVKCTIAVPEKTPRSKTDAIAGYGSEIVVCPPKVTALMDACYRIINEQGAEMVHPFENKYVVAGQGTVALEFLEQIPQLQAIIVPIGGGGLIAGIAVMAKHINPNIKIYGAEPAQKGLERSLRAGRIVCEDRSTLLITIADGLRVADVGDNCFEIILALCEKEIFSVTDDEMSNAMKLVWQRLKLVVEPAGACGVAALLSESFQKLSLTHVGVILSGGNANLDNLPWTNK